jgi:uncharacterized protein YggE
MRNFILLFVIFLTACSAPDKPKTIRVAGEGKVRIMPDQVILTIDISFVKPRMADAVKATQETVDSVTAILEQFSKNNSDIKTSSISANKNYEYINNRSIFTGYQAEQSIDFLLSDIQRFTELTGKLMETKINSISQIQFGHSKADSLFREADLLAYDDALKSATKLCERAKIKLGKLCFLTNTETSGNYDQENVYRATGNGINTYNKGFGGSGFKVSPEVLEFKRTIVSEYEISD